MANENEAIADIITEMRRREKSHYYPKVARNVMHQYANRIEAAWKREREELDKRISDLEAYAKLWTGRADELRLKCDEFYAKAKSVGNAAAMREALGEIAFDCQYAIEGISDKGDYGRSCLSRVLGKARAALSAPARNCDRPECATSKDAQNVWRKEDGGKTPYYEWLLAPAAERKGDSK